MCELLLYGPQQANKIIRRWSYMNGNNKYIFLTNRTWQRKASKMRQRNKIQKSGAPSPRQMNKVRQTSVEKNFVWRLILISFTGGYTNVSAHFIMNFEPNRMLHCAATQENHPSSWVCVCVRVSSSNLKQRETSSPSRRDDKERRKYEKEKKCLKDKRESDFLPAFCVLCAASQRNTEYFNFSQDKSLSSFHFPSFFSLFKSAIFFASLSLPLSRL